MGNGKSVNVNVNSQTDLVQKIYGIASQLSQDYTSKYLDPRFCNSLALIYNDKLMNYRKQDLMGITSTLGLVVDNPGHKQQICDSIIKHYTDRLNLIAVVQKSTSFCSNRIYGLTSGPVCTGNPEIFDQNECAKSNGKWEPYIVPPDESIEENQQWYKYLYHMQDTYLTSLARMYDILVQLKDFDEDITDERLSVIIEEVEQIITFMTSTCAQMYKLTLTTPTYTTEELRLQQEDINNSKTEAAARGAALRAAHGLQPVESK